MVVLQIEIMLALVFEHIYNLAKSKNPPKGQHKCVILETIIISKSLFIVKKYNFPDGKSQTCLVGVLVLSKPTIS